MKKILLILCLFPIFVFSQKSYKIPADSTILNNIGSGKNELVIRNATSNITGGVLTNLGNGVTAFVLGGGSGVSQTTLNDSILAVRNIRKVDTLYKNFASDSIIFFINGIRYSVLDKDNNTSLFPNGLEIVTESRDFLTTDLGKLIIIFPGAHLTMPNEIIFPELFKTIGILQIDTTCWFEQEFGGAKIKSLTTENFSQNEIVLCISSLTDNDSASRLLFLSTAIINEQTAGKYLYDQSQNAIPLSGTEVDKPVTGDIYFNDATSLVLNDGGGGASFRVGYSGVNTFLTFQTGSGLDYIGVNSDGVGASRGLAGGADYSANITDLDYTQKIYVDNAISSNRKVDTSYIFRNSTLDSLCQITVINGISYRSCGKDSVGAGSSTLALDKISDAVDTNTINNGNFKQEWQWNSLANNTGFKLSSTSGGLLNTMNRLFECELTGAMPGTGSSSYAGYFKNTQTVGGAIGLYAEGTGTAINAVGSINITSGSLQLGGGSGGLFYRNSGTTFLQSGAGEQLILLSQNATAGNINFQCSSTPNDIGFQIAKKTLYQHYIYGLGGARYNGNYVSANSTSACIMERNANKIIFSANSGLPGGGTAIYVPNNILTINGGATEATSNVGIGTTSPVASAKLEVSSTTSGFLPPRMTATQASAISTPAQGLMLFVTDTDGTFTSVGWWGYNGSTWEKLNN